MTSFEAVADVALSGLCEKCPLRNLCGDVEMERLEAETTEDGTPEELDRRVGAVEADVASTLVLAAVYKQRRGCNGPIEYDKVCACGNASSCGAYTEAVLLLNAEE